MEKLTGYQKKALRGLAHPLKPTVFIGQKGFTEPLLQSIETALDVHELIKVKFIDFKEKELKHQMIETIEARAGCEMIGMIGHVAIFFRPNKDPEKRKVSVPVRAGDA